MSEDEYHEPDQDELQQESHHKVLPAYEHVKLNVIFYWFSIQTKVQEYIFIKTKNKEVKTDMVASMLLALYLTMLKSMMLKSKKLELVKELDGYVDNQFQIPEKQLIKLIGSFESFLYEIGYLKTSYEQQPWEDRFRNSFGVF
jgi:hypothetical protein